MAVHLAGGKGAGLELLSLLQKVFFWRDQVLPRPLHSLTVPLKVRGCWARLSATFHTGYTAIKGTMWRIRCRLSETAGDIKTLNYTWGWWRQLMPFIPALGRWRQVDL